MKFPLTPRKRNSSFQNTENSNKEKHDISNKWAKNKYYEKYNEKSYECCEAKNKTEKMVY